MESSPPNQTPPTGENSFTCSPLKDSILHPSSRKWCSGPPRTRIPKTKPLSGKSRRTRSNSWLPCDNAGPERLCLLLKSTRGLRHKLHQAFPVLCPAWHPFNDACAQRLFRKDRIYLG